MEWNKTRVIAGIAGVFLLGAVTGGALTRIRDVHHARAMLETSEPDARRDMIMRVLRRLELSPQQQEQAREIVEAQRVEYEALLEETRPRMMEMREEMVAELNAILEPEQQERLQEMLERADERRERRPNHERWGGGRADGPGDGPHRDPRGDRPHRDPHGDGPHRDPRGDRPHRDPRADEPGPRGRHRGDGPPPPPPGFAPPGSGDLDGLGSGAGELPPSPGPGAAPR